MIEPIAQWKGPSCAKVICDLCLAHEVVNCGYTRRGRTKTQPDESQCIRHVTAKGWSNVKGILRCQTCEAERKNKAPKPTWLEAAEDHIKQEARVNTKTVIKTTIPTPDASTMAPRQPTPDQELDIIEALLTCYDRKAKRYSGTDTDKTVAESIGGGIMPGWVASIREAKFGPSGGNEELDEIRAEIADLIRTANTLRDMEVADAAARHAETIARAQALDKRLSAVCAAVGPKAARI